MFRTMAVRITLAALSVGAAAMHFGMTPQHAADSFWVGAFFVLCAWAQIVLAGVLLLRPSREAVVAGAALHVLLIASWALSTTPGSAPGITAGFEAAFVLVALAALGAPRRVPVVAGVAVATLVLGGTTAAIASPSVMGRHPATATATATTASSSSAAPAGHVHTATTTAPGGTAGLDGFQAHSHIVTSDGPPTAEQIARADALIQATKKSIARWSDYRAAEADGFRAIQGPKSEFVHFVNFAWIADGKTLDVDHPESLVYRSTNGTKDGYRLESAMYILPKYGAPIPDVGGSLTPWHNHGDLCFAPTGMIVATTETTGTCPTGSTNLKTPDMLHVWIVDHPDGPFGGIE